MSEDGRKGWLADFSDTYGVVKVWIIGVFGPLLAVSELLQGRFSLGLGLGFVCAWVWTILATQLGSQSPALDRIGKVSLLIGAALMAWHYVLWWVGYLA